MTGPRINPDEHGPSGTFAALERATPIVQADGDVPTTTSMRVANGTGVQHKNVLELIGNNAADFAEFGPVAFETRPHPTQVGAMQRIAILNEEHATLLLTYMRNNDVVKDFKKRLVREFSALRRATATPPARPLPQTYAAALRELATEVEARELAEARARELAVPASAWNELAEAAGDYSVADAAKVLSRDPKINTGERRLFAYMDSIDWLFRRDGRWRAYQAQVDNGRLVEKVGKPYVRDGQMVNGEPTVRITPKGLGELRRRLGGLGDAKLALAVAE